MNDYGVYLLLGDIPFTLIDYIYIYLRKSLHSKRRELNKVILRAVSYIVLLRCRLIYNQHYAPYEHILFIYTTQSR